LGVEDDTSPAVAAAHGATKALLEWGEERIIDLAARLRDREVAFIGNRETMALVRRERRTEEAGLLRRYVRDKRLREITVLGLALRRLEKRPEDAERLQELRRKIHRRHAVNGLQAAELVQRGIVALLISRFMSEEHVPEDITRALENLLNRVRRYAMFVKSSDNINSLVAEVKPKILAQSPDLFIVLGRGEAMEKAKRLLAALLKALPKGFVAERHETGSDFSAFIGKRDGDTFELTLPV
jgi:hypothetical protein